MRQAAEVDGKANHNLHRLQLFREFYVIVIVYIYFTRIVVYLLASSIPFYLLWLGDLFTELATLLFFVIVGYKFRPSSESTYSLLKGDDDDGYNGNGSGSGRRYRGPREDVEGQEYGLPGGDLDVDVGLGLEFVGVNNNATTTTSTIATPAATN